MRGVADVVQSGLMAKSGVKKHLARRRWAPKWVFWRPRRGGVIDGGSGVGGPAHNWKGGLSETGGTVLSL